MNRRRFVAGVTTGALGSTAGCFSLLLGSGDGYVRPDGEPEVVPDARQCDSDTLRSYRRLYEDEPRWGNTESLRLRVDSLSFEYGETATFTLTNTSDHPVTTTSDREFQFEIHTDEGWQELRHCVGSCRAFGTATVGHAPGTGFEWEVTLTERGVGDAGIGGVVVCSDLVSGRYRFVYAGADTPVAVAFDLRR